MLVDSNGNKYTSSITTGARKRHLIMGWLLNKELTKAGKNYWWAVPMSEFEKTCSCY